MTTPDDQLDLFAQPAPGTLAPPIRTLAMPSGIDYTTRARTNDPMTSHEAAALVEPFGDEHHAIILTTLKRMRTGTFHEIAAACELNSEQVHRRMPEMEQRGLVAVLRDEYGDDVCRPGPSGRRCRVWRALS